MAPAVHHGVRRFGAYAGDLGEGFEQLALDALGVVFEVAL